MKTIALTVSRVMLLVGAALMPALTGCGTGIVGGDETPCDQAVDHLASCGITDLPDPGGCTPDKAQLADQILATACADLGERSSFSGAGCGSFWALFKPSCWGGGSGADPYGYSLPLNASCNFDDECQSRSCKYRHHLGRTVCVKAEVKKALGASCSWQDAGWCPSGTTCHGGRCLGYQGSQCDHDSDCISNVCEGGHWGSCQ